MPKKNKLKDKANKRKNSCGLFFVDQILLGMVSALGYGWFTQWHSIGESCLLPICCQVSITNNVLVRNGSPCPFSSISAGTCAGLMRVAVISGVYMFITLTVPGRHWEIIHPFWLLQYFCLLFVWSFLMII